MPSEVFQINAPTVATQTERSHHYHHLHHTITNIIKASEREQAIMIGFKRRGTEAQKQQGALPGRTRS